MAMDEWEWLGQLTSKLGEPPLQRQQIGTVLRMSRVVARGVERKLAPVTAFVAGMHVVRRVGEGATGEEALLEVQAAVTELVPEGAIQDGGGGGGRGSGFRRFGRRRTR